jgi:ribosome-binding ATPase YchF (GTP1/OBG family)
VLYVCNVDEATPPTATPTAPGVREGRRRRRRAVVVSAAIEAEIATMAAEDRGDFLADLGLHETGLARVIRAGYDLLHLITFFTAGPKERAPGPSRKARRRRRRPASSTPISSAASSAPRRSPTTIIVSFGGEAGARDAGKLRSEGKEYVVQDGDVMLFRFNV